MPEQDVFLERALLDRRLLTEQQMEQARQHAARNENDFAGGLLECELITGRDLALVRADVCETPYVNLADYEPCFANTSLVPRNIAERYLLFPLFMIDDVLTVAMDDPLNLDATDQVRQLVKCEVDAVLAEREQLRALINRAYSLSQSMTTGPQGEADIEIDVEDNESSQPVVAAVNQLLADAVEQRASDVHINPDEHDLHIRYRIDGMLQQRQGPPLSMHAGIVQRLKVMANLDLTQTRRPQDGKFRFRHNGALVEVRMSTIPTVCGENVVLRLLANTRTIDDFRDLGMSSTLISEFENVLANPYGMVLVTGPTGSGKTTTLYTALNKLNDPSRNIMTIEDPVEIRLPFVRQIQVHPEIGLDFARTLRSILRQDPDVVLVGEIRDSETAAIALQASLTGHLVLSTLHTNDAVGAVARLRDYGLPSFVINSAVLGVMAQRLVRRVCQHCLIPDDVNEQIQARFGLTNTQGFVRGKGCSRCGQTGYRGRVGIYELFTLTASAKQLIEQSAPTDAIRRRAVAEGMQLMWKDGLSKARLGHTTLAEIASAASVIELDQQHADRANELLREVA